jgi:putative molybdopterin biosynthesis protein
MAVAVAVLSGKDDAGLGILAAARALGLDFIPLVEERYDLVIPTRFLALPMMEAVVEVISSSGFQTAVQQMGGYSTRETGNIVYQS